MSDLVSQMKGKYVCPECKGETCATGPVNKGVRNVYVDHKPQCETGIRHRMTATKNRRIPNVQSPSK
jgi:hypothetical protein